ncbi:DNase I-like protein [Mycena venus]|uniref:DNase I-like protein n=1 Tax=Mycena venus TaxID=2733690 RepID=A0A8H6YU65_9AGAR|nr:DNase I-like protein [Mycena venus]
MAWFSQSLLLATCVSLAACTRITDISGVHQRTPMLGQTVNLTALVTAKGKSGFYILGDPVEDQRASNGLSVFTTSTSILSQVNAGDMVNLVGKVAEFRPAADPDYLLLTELTSPTNITVLSRNNTVTPLVLDKYRSPPTEQFSPLDVGHDGWLSVPNNQSRIDTVNGTLQPDNFGIDFWASLLGQIVSVPKPVAINFPNSFSEFWVHSDEWPVTGKNSRGGLSLTFGPHGIPDANPEAIIIGSPLDGTKNPKTQIGTKLTDIVGVITYQFGFYYVLPLTAPTVISNPNFAVAPTTLTSTDTDRCAITVGDYNVENMAPTGTHVQDVANHIAHFLLTPDIVFIQEVQDNSGPTDNGIVSANVTLSTLVQAIANVSNVTYSWVDIDPVDGEDGGQPGGNIRQAYLYRPEKLHLVQPPGVTAGHALNATSVLTPSGKPLLSLNPGRVDPTNAAWQDSRKPLAAQWITATGHSLFTVNLHLVSKGGSTTGHGDARPPVNLPVAQRTSQVETVSTFVKSILEVDPWANIVVAGDCNEYTQTRSVFQSLTPLLTEIDEVANVPPVERYTYVFDNNCEQLDHMFISPALSSRYAEVEHIHANNWAATISARVSDHDPTVARIRTIFHDPHLKSFQSLSSLVSVRLSDFLQLFLANF